MKILLATDGSVYSKAAAEALAHRQLPPDTRLRIVSVYKLMGITMHMEPMGTLREYHAEMDRKAQKAAEMAVDEAETIIRKGNPSLAISTSTPEGSPKEMILKEAEEFGADLIVVGSHGYGAVKSFLLGSVSHAVAMYAKCSVEIVRVKQKN